ncbi:MULTISPECIES: DUF2726 domain-containing protein [unclassified Halomonas]|uniref:DUF2726 domain-containing protein n=1 Tax=unclassified Halomonas TaxID=2609666 RepID=UPI00022D2A23|nr:MULTISPECIES: DUF2726 domain-containing protein [unclassified Halomonas]AJY52120.1 protein of unknown function DUF2726 [Halomonas sp. KO116]EHA13724.1 hypothetical protein HAL1_19481 [Halomonas sp. HAL1]WKV93623.1 DUF2726 domain-containing protein [Halomonas sp. HAL1]|tara:strand:+ start:229 stop:903 length:675 start_codon:yes stop_codon:yes gene_type:complete
MNPLIGVEDFFIKTVVFVIIVALCTAILQGLLSKRIVAKKRKNKARKQYVNAMNYRRDGVVRDVKEEVEDKRIEKLKESYEKKDKNYSEKLIMDGGAYVAKAKMMSASEQGVYKILEKAYGDKYYIFCQVRVVDIVQPNITKYQTWTKEYKSLFWQISQWHFDYVMCDKSSFSIFCALELDDASHERADRVKRDRILNAVCKDAGVVLKRMKLNHESKRVEVIS